MNDDITVSHQPDQDRYEIRVGDALAGFAEYRLPDDQHVDITHTWVDDEYAGQGLAGRLVADAIADVRRQDKRIIPTCPYVAKWLGKHPEHDEIVDRP